MKKISLLLLALVFIWSCSDSGSGGPAPVTIPPATVEPTDATAVSTEMGTENPSWTEQAGNVPPTNGAIAVTSVADGDTVAATNGLPVSVDIDVPLGDSLSLVFGVEGANAHYEVPADPDGRTGLIKRNSDGNRSLFEGRLIRKDLENMAARSNPGGYLFVFNIPASIKPGTFCVRFAVTNAAGDISNYITFCVTLQQRGGTGTGDLTSKRWKASEEQDYDMNGDPIGDPFMYGVLETQIDTLPCLNPPPAFEVVTFFEGQQDIFLRFRTNGTSLINSVASFRFLDFSSECGNLSYIEDNFSVDLEGGWSYNNVTKIMTLSINGFYDPDGTYNAPEVIQLEVLVNTPTRIEVKFIEEDLQGGYSVLTMIPG